MEPQSYSQLTIVLVLGLGIPLAFVRPYAAFLLAASLLTAGHVAMFNQTRLAGLGPYLNLSDACVLVAVAAFFFDRVAAKKPVQVPQIVPLLLFVVILGAVQSFWKLGWTYDTMRATRWALDFPIAYFLGANLVTSADRARKLIWILLAGALLAAVQHHLYVVHIWRSKSVNMATYEGLRTIGYWGGCMASAFLVSALAWQSPRGVWRKAFWAVAALLFIGTIFMSQTRSLWLATAAGGLCVMIVFGRGHRLRGIMRVTLPGAIVVLGGVWLCGRVMPGLSVPEVLVGRMSKLFARNTQNLHVGTRERAFHIEMDQYLHGTLIFGRGLSFFQTIPNPKADDRNIAFGHLGYVTYLSQLGVIGLLVYGLLLPLWTFLDASRLWRYGHDPALRYLGLLGGASILCMSIMFLMSSQFLAVGYFAPAVLYGGVIALARESRRMEFVAEPIRDDERDGLLRGVRALA